MKVKKGFSPFSMDLKLDGRLTPDVLGVEHV